jgi:hypothetical protein
MKTLLIASALLSSSAAFAGTYTTSADFGTQGSVIDLAIGFGLNEVITVDGFDASLGNLTGVEINVFSQIDTAGHSTNNSSLDGQSQFTFLFTDDWTISSSVGSFTFRDQGVLFQEIDLNHEVNEVFDYGHLTDYQVGSINTLDVNAFLSDVDFTFTLNALTSFSNSTVGGSAEFENVIDSASWGKVEVVYTYENVIASVPETGSLAIFGLGLAGFALSRKFKK